MSNTSKVAAAVVLVFGFGVATVFVESGPDTATRAASAPGPAPTTTTTTTTTAVPVAVAEAPTPGPAVDIPPTASVAAEPAPVPSKSAPVARESAPVAPTPAPVAPTLPAAIPDVAPLVPAVPVIPPSAPTGAPEVVRPVCTDTSLDHRSPALSGLGLESDSKASRTAMIEAYARCVADGGAIDPRHDDINGDGDGDYCGGHVPTGAVGLSSAVDAQFDCLAELASRYAF
jgi:hypothetical protein